MNIEFRNLTPIFLILVFFGCGKDPVQLLMSSNFLEKNEVKLDGNPINKRINENGYDILMVQPGKHSIEINGNSKKDFLVGKNGGLLNLEGKEFVLFPINFQKDENSRSISFPLPVIVDSLVIFSKKMGKNQSEITKILNNKALKRTALYSGGKKFSSKNIFIDKEWDYGINENVPNSVKLKRPEDWNLEVKTKLMLLDEFLTISKLSNEYQIEKIEDQSLVQLIESYNN